MRGTDGAHESARTWRETAGGSPRAGLGFFKDAADSKRGCRCRELVVREVQIPFVRKAFFVRQGQPNRNAPAVIVNRVQFALSDQFMDTNHRQFIRIEVCVNRVLRNDGGQPRLVLDGQVAQGQVVVADSAVNRRCHVGEPEIEFLCRQIGLGNINAGGVLCDGRPVLVDLLQTYRLTADCFIRGQVARLRRLVGVLRARAWLRATCALA